MVGVLRSFLPFDECAVLNEARTYIQVSIGATSVTVRCAPAYPSVQPPVLIVSRPLTRVQVYDAADESAPDPGRRRAAAIPGHPGLFLADSSAL